MLAVAMDRRSAADELGLAPGDQLAIVPLADDPGVATPVAFGRDR
jgi:hypothetical protein